MRPRFQVPMQNTFYGTPSESDSLVALNTQLALNQSECSNVFFFRHVMIFVVVERQLGFVRKRMFL